MAVKNKINYEKKRYQYLMTFDLLSKRHLKALEVIEAYREAYGGTFLDAIINIICSAEGKYKCKNSKEQKKEDMTGPVAAEINKAEKEWKKEVGSEGSSRKGILDELLDEMYGE